LDALDYAILYGNYSIAKFFIEHQGMKPRRTVKDYEGISDIKKMYYVNYHSLLINLKAGHVPEILPNFFEPVEEIQE
jgi:hypothetical protein